MKTSKSLSLKTPVKKLVLPFEPGLFLEDLKAVCTAESVSTGKELQIEM